MIIAGLSTSKIVKQLVVEESTICSHRRSISNKTGGSSALSLSRWVQQRATELQALTR